MTTRRNPTCRPTHRRTILHFSAALSSVTRTQKKGRVPGSFPQTPGPQEKVIVRRRTTPYLERCRHEWLSPPRKDDIAVLKLHNPHLGYGDPRAFRYLVPGCGQDRDWVAFLPCKPHPRTYHWAANEVGTPIGNCMLIATHGWDVAGATIAGMRAAFLERPGITLYPLSPDIEISGRDMVAVGERLVAMPK